MQRFVNKMKAWKKCLGLSLVASAVGVSAGSAEAEVIQQTFQQSASGALNFGQYFEVDSAFFSGPQQLESIEFAKGNNISGTTAIYLDIYEIGTASFSTLNFNSGFGVSSTNYLGSSDNAVNVFAAASGSAVVWTFSGITLETDTSYFAVISNDAVAGNHRGTSLIAARQKVGDDFFGGAVFNNITTEDSNPLFGGSPTPDAANEPVNDNFYTITLVPEPGSLALLSVGALMLSRRRRN